VTAPRWLDAPRLLEAVLIAAPLLAVLVAGLMGVSVPMMTLDVLSITRVHPLSGFLSNLGILVLCASAAVWTFTRSVNARRAVADVDGARHLAWAAAISGYMTLDDLFQIHEIIVPRYLGLPDEVVLALLAAAILWFLHLSRREPHRAGLPWLVAALGFLGASVVIGLASSLLWRMGQWQYLLEDGAKWIGLCLWLKYAMVHCRWRLGVRGSLARATHEAAPAAQGVRT
jgi:hypothetical protein